MGTRQLHALCISCMCVLFIYLDFNKILFGSIHYLMYFKKENENDFVSAGKSESKGGSGTLRCGVQKQPEDSPEEKPNH